MSRFEILTGAVRILYQETRSVRQLPVNFSEPDINLFKHELEIPIPATRLLKLNRANVSPSGIIFQGGRVLAESFNYRDEFIRWANVKGMVKFLVQSYAFTGKQRMAGPAFWIIDNWRAAYFHWLLDALPRLYAVRDQLADATLILPEEFRNLPYILPSLAPFAIRSIRFAEQNKVLQCNQLLVPTHTAPSGQYNEEIVRGLRQLYQSYYGPGSDDSPGKIYISRSKATKRKIVNESEVVEAVEERGFSVVCLEDYPFEQQVRMMLNATHLVSNHGAGLANMLFLPEKSRVLELRKFEDSHCNCYFALASALRLQYYYQLCRARNPAEDAGTAHISVDIQELHRNLERMLGEDKSDSFCGVRADRI
jgi:Glycosyltransferase 61